MLTFSSWVAHDAIVVRKGYQSIRLRRMRTSFYRQMWRNGIWLRPLIALAFGHSLAYATIYTATFDDLGEGPVGTSFSDGGLTFSDIDERIPEPSIYSFDIDQATATLPPPFSPPNVLTFGGYIPGPECAFGRFGSAWIDFSGIGSSASLDVFSLAGYPQNTLSLEAWDGSTMVASVSTSFANPNTIQYSSLALNNVAPFDRLELVSSGPVDYGVSFIDLDNVSVTTVPEPNGLSLMILGFVTAICLRRRAKGSSHSETLN